MGIFATTVAIRAFESMETEHESLSHLFDAEDKMKRLFLWVKYHLWTRWFKPKIEPTSLERHVGNYLCMSGKVYKIIGATKTTLTLEREIEE